MTTHARLTQSMVGSIGACKLYFLTRERNAWHSTWIRRYSPASIQLSFLGAALEAEKHRTRGTTFIIQELPALRISSGAGHLFVTDINSKNPLEDYSRDALRASVISDLRPNTEEHDRYLIHGAPMIKAALSFKPESRFWRKPQPPKNHVLVLGIEETGLEFDLIGRSELFPPLWRWYSSPSSGRSPLNWSEAFDAPISADKVLELSKTNEPNSNNITDLFTSRSKN